jgi:hypothetical protein
LAATAPGFFPPRQVARFCRVFDKARIDDLMHVQPGELGNVDEICALDAHYFIVNASLTNKLSSGSSVFSKPCSI